MTRAPILSAVAAALLLGLATAGPVAAEDAATPATPATTPSATPAPVKGEFDNSCAMGLAEGQTVKTDCSVNWTAPDGKVYCFSSEKSKETFLKNAEANIKKAQDFRAAKASAAATGKTKNFTEEDVNAAVKKAVDERTKDGAFVFRDPKLNADLHLIFDEIKVVRGMEGYGWFPSVIFHDRTSRRRNTPSTSGSSPRVRTSN